MGSERISKVELFEKIRQERFVNKRSISAIAKMLGVHRRVVRQAIANASPPERKRPERTRGVIGSVQSFIDTLLLADLKAPRKQRHTAHRIYDRIRCELPDIQVAERTVRQYVQHKKAELGLKVQDIAITQSYTWGAEAQVDWYEAQVYLGGEPQTLQLFAIRSMASGAAFHRAYVRANQQAFLDAHELAFHYFGGVFRVLRYDNLKVAVKKILQGHTRLETTRFKAFRSHWCFAAEFCNPAKGQEKGGVEGELGYFRRNHLVPVPDRVDLEELNNYLLECCCKDKQRRIGERDFSVEEGMELERPHLTALAQEDFDLDDVTFPKVDRKRCVCVGTNYYSTPLKPGTEVQARSQAQFVEIWHGGKRIARHERSFSRRQQVLELEHYLDVLEHKPGAFPGSKALQLWREQGRWTPEFDQLWKSLMDRHGRANGTRFMIELLRKGQDYGYTRLAQAIRHALDLGTTDVAAVTYLLAAPALKQPPVEPLQLTIDSLLRYERPLPEIDSYDQLLDVTEVIQ